MLLMTGLLRNITILAALLLGISLSISVIRWTWSSLFSAWGHLHFFCGFSATSSRSILAGFRIPKRRSVLLYVRDLLVRSPMRLHDWEIRRIGRIIDLLSLKRRWRHKGATQPLRLHFSFRSSRVNDLLI